MRHPLILRVPPPSRVWRRVGSFDRTPGIFLLLSCCVIPTEASRFLRRAAEGSWQQVHSERPWFVSQLASVVGATEIPPSAPGAPHAVVPPTAWVPSGTTPLPLQGTSFSLPRLSRDRLLRPFPLGFALSCFAMPSSPRRARDLLFFSGGRGFSSDIRWSHEFGLRPLETLFSTATSREGNQP